MRQEVVGTGIPRSLASQTMWDSDGLIPNILFLAGVETNVKPPELICDEVTKESITLWDRPSAVVSTWLRCFVAKSADASYIIFQLTAVSAPKTGRVRIGKHPTVW